MTAMVIVMVIVMANAENRMKKARLRRFIAKLQSQVSRQDGHQDDHFVNRRCLFGEIPMARSHVQEFDRCPNKAAICRRMTRSISEKPEIGLAAAGVAVAELDDVPASAARVRADTAGAADCCASWARRLSANCLMICAAVA